MPRLLLAPLLLLVVACGSNPDAPGHDAPEPSSASEGRGPSGPWESWSPAAPSLSGRVRVVGDLPVARPLRLSAEQTEGCCAEGERVDPTDRSLRVDAEGGLQDLVVVLVPLGGGPLPHAAQERGARPAGTHTLRLERCRMEPHVTVALVGDRVLFENSDAIQHLPHVYARQKSPSSRTRTPLPMEPVACPVPDRIRVTCDVHPWMGAWIVVVDDPLHACTAADGSFRIDDVPPGTYRLELWHERLGTLRRRVELPGHDPLTGERPVLELVLDAARDFHR